jgi:hypothetical protein
VEIATSIDNVALTVSKFLASVNEFIRSKVTNSMRTKRKHVGNPDEAVQFKVEWIERRRENDAGEAGRV